ncbi:uncharacterized protein LOC119866817 isoform X1 [Canis lupus familiaris]|uniref:uncharacterized protein LOC119866817 isoform X1 n=1 Tax=Canis lupus familiaris TaxID=9615 RepID=UPI0018F7D46F|nr:uncharacterized protein LOC119866817 isoform X1 [Canis lupus familiaris]
MGRRSPRSGRPGHVSPRHAPCGRRAGRPRPLGGRGEGGEGGEDAERSADGGRRETPGARGGDRVVWFRRGASQDGAGRMCCQSQPAASSSRSPPPLMLGHLLGIAPRSPAPEAKVCSYCERSAIAWALGAGRRTPRNKTGPCTCSRSSEPGGPRFTPWAAEKHPQSLHFRQHTWKGSVDEPAKGPYFIGGGRTLHAPRPPCV